VSFIQDPETNEIVKYLNESTGEPAAHGTGSPKTRIVGDDAPLAHWLRRMITTGASDLHITAHASPRFRVDGAISTAAEEPLESEEIRSLLHAWWDEIEEGFQARGSHDTALRFDRRRFRVNVHRERGATAIAIRSLPVTIPSLESLNLPKGLASLVEPMRGLVLVCGATGTGKTSTLAALTGHMNRTQNRKIITIEDPVEYEHVSAQCLIEHIEIGRDSPSFTDALRASLRQDPDVIMIGELRDLDTISTALTAAETGHLIFATLHTGDAAQALSRLIDVFPAERQPQIRQQIAVSLNAILAQQLVPRADGAGRLPVTELLIANIAVRNHIRHGKLEQLASEITLGKRLGMISLEDSLALWVRKDVISREEAEIRSRRPEELRSLLNT